MAKSILSPSSSDYSIVTVSASPEKRSHIQSALELLLNPVLCDAIPALALGKERGRKLSTTGKKAASSEDILSPPGQHLENTKAFSLDLLNERSSTPDMEVVKRAEALWREIVSYLHSKLTNETKSSKTYHYSQCFFGSAVLRELTLYLSRLTGSPIAYKKAQLLSSRLVQFGVIKDVSKEKILELKESRLYRFSTRYIHSAIDHGMEQKNWSDAASNVSSSQV